MAAEKKKTSSKSSAKNSEAKKTVSKKAVSKKTESAGKKTVKKSTKLLTENNLTINVPSGGQVIKFFNLMPAMPTPMGPGDWQFTEQGSSLDLESITVVFPENPVALERQLERAVLVISIQQNPADEGTWRFALGGVATDQADADPDNDISVDIIDNGFTLVVYMHVLEDSAEQIPFGFVASFTDALNGYVSIYESQDPRILTRRP